MNLTGNELVELEIITGEIPEQNIQQHGIDLNVIGIEKVAGYGHIPKEGKTQVASRLVQRVDENNCWKLEPGVYDFTFSQGCKVPPNRWLEIIQRSSLSRNGTFIRSAIFDAGFETENIGTMVMVLHPIHIEYGARVAQITSHSSNTVQNLYSGQFQNDQQRK